jgi:hypothetical protein
MSKFDAEKIVTAIRTLQGAAVPATGVDETEYLRAEVEQLKVAPVRILKKKLPIVANAGKIGGD